MRQLASVVVFAGVLALANAFGVDGSAVGWVQSGKLSLRLGQVKLDASICQGPSRNAGTFPRHPGFGKLVSTVRCSANEKDDSPRERGSVVDQVAAKGDCLPQLRLIRCSL